MKKPEVKKTGKLTNLEIINLYSNLKKLKQVPGLKLNYAISRTIAKLKPLAEAYDMDKLIPKEEDFVEYETTMADKYKEIADGRTKIINNQTGEYEALDLDINSEAVVKARREIQEKYAEAITNRKKDIKEYSEWLLTECEDDYELFKVKMDDVPGTAENLKDIWDVCALLIEE